MLNFTAYIPTKVHFGKGILDKLPAAAQELGKKVLLVYGKGSVVRNGYYDQVKAKLHEAGCEVVDFSGVKPNPICDDADQAVEIGVKNDVDFVVALGGGSVIDTAKVVAVCLAEKAKAWDVMTGEHKATKTLPLVAVLTLAATGTEMNHYAVLQNHETNRKIGFGTECMFPRYSFLDPTFTLSVPKSYTAYGIVDLIAHTLEHYFGAGDSPLSDQFTYGLLKEAMDFGPKLLDDLGNYDLRARMMWAASMALNGTNNYGKSGGDWGVHGFGHNMSLLFDTPHGATLSVGFPAWMKLQKERIPERILALGENVFGVSSIDETILAFEKLFKSLDCPVSFADLEYSELQKEELKTLVLEEGTSGYVQTLNDDDRVKVLELMN